MANVYIDDGRLSIELPDGFAVMTLEQVQALYGMNHKEMWGARNESCKMVVTVIWKDLGGLAAKLSDNESFAKHIEKTLSRWYRASEYNFGGFFETTVAGKDAYGLRHTHVPEGIPQESEIVTFRNGKRRYTLYYYTRPEVAQENRTMYEAMVASLALS